MSLKLTLKPHEKMIIAGAAITNGGSTAELIIENNVPILRKKDIMKEQDAVSPAKRIYFIVQLMYLDMENRISYQGRYWDLVRNFLDAAPSSQALMNELNEFVLAGNYYAALKSARRLMRHEENILFRGKGEGRQ